MLLYPKLRCFIISHLNQVDNWIGTLTVTSIYLIVAFIIGEMNLRLILALGAIINSIGEKLLQSFKSSQKYKKLSEDDKKVKRKKYERIKCYRKYEYYYKKVEEGIIDIYTKVFEYNTEKILFPEDKLGQM